MTGTQEPVCLSVRGGCSNALRMPGLSVIKRFFASKTDAHCKLAVCVPVVQNFSLSHYLEHIYSHSIVLGGLDEIS